MHFFGVNLSLFVTVSSRQGIAEDCYRGSATKHSSLNFEAYDEAVSRV